MRIFISCIVWVIFVGGLAVYMHQRTSIQPTAVSEKKNEDRLAENYTLEVVTTFSLEPDPFAFQRDDGTAEFPMNIFLDTRPLLQLSKGVLPGTPLPEIRLANLTAGTHEIHIQAAAPDDGRLHAVRLLILKSGLPFSETTLWSQSGSLLSGIVRFEVTSSSDKGASNA